MRNPESTTPTVPADASKARIAVLERDLKRATEANAVHIEALKDLGQRLEAMRLHTHARFHEEECWIWQGDGSDNLSSLTCPVVIRPEVLAALMAPADVMAGAGALKALSDLVEDLEMRANLKEQEERGVVDCSHWVYTQAIRTLAAARAVEKGTT